MEFKMICIVQGLAKEKKGSIVKHMQEEHIVIFTCLAYFSNFFQDENTSCRIQQSLCKLLK